MPFVREKCLLMSDIDRDRLLRLLFIKSECCCSSQSRLNNCLQNMKFMSLAEWFGTLYWILSIQYHKCMRRLISYLHILNRSRSNITSPESRNRLVLATMASSTLVLTSQTGTTSMLCSTMNLDEGIAWSRTLRWILIPFTVNAGVICVWYYHGERMFSVYIVRLTYDLEWRYGISLNTLLAHLLFAVMTF